MKSCIPLIIILSSDLFFALIGIIGYTYLGRENSSLYIIYSIVVASIGIYLFIYDSLAKGQKYSKKQIILLLIPLNFTVIYLFSVLFNGENNIVHIRYLYFVLWGVPSILLGIYVTKKNRFRLMVKYLDIIMIIFTTSSLIYFYNVLEFGTRANISGATYQNIAYTSAFAFGINLYFIFHGKNHSRFNFTKTKLYSIFSYILLILQILGVISSGGKGGMVLIGIYTVFITKQNYKKLSISAISKLILISLIVLLSLLLTLPQLIKYPIFSVSLDRVFEYISSEGINWAGTSNRDIFYRMVLDWIMQSPLYGHGIFHMWKYSTLPHNIILEVLLQGGIIYLFLFVIVGVYTIKRINVLIRYNGEYRVIAVLMTYSLTMLSFSGSYMVNSIFWFCLSFILSIDNNYSKNTREL